MDRKKIILIVILALVVLGSVGAMAYKRFVVKPGADESAAGVSGSANQPAGIPTVNSVPPTSPADIQALSEQVVRAAMYDQDLDGLSDDEEKKYGTSQISSDTDNDGLLDKDEVMLYKTNPLKSDTDADGKNDGYEVRRNLNPLGAGQLVVPETTSSLKTTSTTQ